MPREAGALPFFSRQVGRDCTYCHSLVPRLNDTGRTFRANGYRFDAEGEWKGVRDYEVLPVSFEAEVEALYNRTTDSGATTESNDLKIEEVEIMAGGALGKKGRVSAMAMLAVEETSSGYEVNVPKAFVQINDLAGPRALGILNIRAGKWDVGLPHFNTRGSVITNRYLVDSALGFISREEKGFELNGAVNSYSEDDSTTAHRYAAGLVTVDSADDDKLKGYYGWYSVSFNEVLSFGAIYRGGRTLAGATETSFNSFGGAASIEYGPVIFTAGYFLDKRNGLSDRDDFVTELVVMPLSRLSLAGRYELLATDGRKRVKSQSFMTRYHVMSNVFVQAEYRGMSDDDNVVGTNEDETKLRLLLVALF